MRRRVLGALALAGLIGAGACNDLNDDLIGVDGDPPAPPRALTAWYYGGEVVVSWELHPQWDGESFRVYSKRDTDPDYFLIADVTSCAGGVCIYGDVNVSPGVTYLYFVAAVDPDSGVETATESTVEVFVPHPDPPPVPGGVRAVALDGANYLRWDAAARGAEDFSHYRVYLVFQGSTFFLGETDSEGFLDLLAENGLTYTYFVTSMDDQGHESGDSPTATGTPRPDFNGEWIYDYFDVPGSSGFRFRETEDVDPIVDGDASGRHFRLETDGAGWWLVPGPGTRIHADGFITTALKCGPAADASCVDLDVAPTSGYVDRDVALFPQTTYVLRVRGDDGADHYGVIRVELQGFDQDDNALMIFDWAYQLQPGNPRLAPRRMPVR